jgi:hypothetical protein
MDRCERREVRERRLLIAEVRPAEDRVAAMLVEY